MILFLAPEALLGWSPRRKGNGTLSGCERKAIVTRVEPYAPHLEVVLAPRGEPVAGCDARAPSFLRKAVEGSLWDEPPPVELPRFDQFQFWIASRYILRWPSWMAIDRPDPSWPEDQLPHLIPVGTDGAGLEAWLQLARRLDGFTWPLRWWGKGAGPTGEELDRMASLLAIWSVSRSRARDLMGDDVAEFRTRLGLMVQTHAGACLRLPGYGTQRHWIHIPNRRLGGRRPIDVMLRGGLEGFAEVHSCIWRA